MREVSILKYPDYLVHYHHNQATLFHSILEQGYTRSKEILRNSPLASIAKEEYVDERIIVENHIRTEFYKKGGIPLRNFPLYASLGESKYLEGNSVFTKIIIPLSVFNKEQLSFTFTDSMFKVHNLKPEVFLINELSLMIDIYGLKSPEAQIWDDEPLRNWICENKISL